MPTHTQKRSGSSLDLSRQVQRKISKTVRVSPFDFVMRCSLLTHDATTSRRRRATAVVHFLPISQQSLSTSHPWRRRPSSKPGSTQVLFGHCSRSLGCKARRVWEPSCTKPISLTFARVCYLCAVEWSLSYHWNRHCQSSCLPVRAPYYTSIFTQITHL